MPTIQERSSQLENWLNEEGIPFNKLPEGSPQRFKDAILHILVLLENIPINIITTNGKLDKIIFSGGVNLNAPQKQNLASMSDLERDKFMSLYEMGILQMQLFASLQKQSSIEGLGAITWAYHGELNKTNFIDKLYSIKRAIMFISQILSQLSPKSEQAQPVTKQNITPDSQNEIRGYG